MATLYDDNDVTEGSHEAVAYREPPLLGPSARRRFRDDDPECTDALPEPGVPARIGLIDPAGDDCNRRRAGAASSFVSRPIDSDSES